MHRTITILAICLLFFAFPRVLSEEINAEKTELAKTNGNADEPENITVIITEIKPMASELIAGNVTELVKNDLLIKPTNETSEKVVITEIILNNTTKENITKEVDSKAITQETNIVEHHVSTPKLKPTENIVQENKNRLLIKQTTVDKLKEQIQQAKEDLSVKIKRLEEVKDRANAAQELSVQAQNHLKTLIFALNSLQGSIIQSSKAAFETDWQFQLQNAMYNDAKRKYARLSRELEMTKNDYEKTKIATQNALMSAKIAQKNIDNSEEKLSKVDFTGKNDKILLGNFSSQL